MGRAALLASAVALAACGHRTVIMGVAMPDGCEGDRALDSDRCMGWVFDQIELAAGVPVYPDPAIQSYVARIGERLVRASGDPRHWTFHVLDSSAVEAHAGLGTTVYITRGAIATLRDEAELAGLIGHEIGHGLANHPHESYEEMVRGLPRDDDARASREAQDNEIQADALAVVLVARAGYDPRAVETMLRAIAGAEGTPDPDKYPTHPGWAERVTRIRALLADYPAGGDRDAERFRTTVASLAVGDDPRRAAVVGDALVFAEAGVAYDVPGDAKVDDGVATASIDGTIATLRPISPLAASALQPHYDDDGFNIASRGPRGALLIMVPGPHGQQIARALRDHARPPRPDELARIHPRLVDLGAPRALWPAVPP